MKDHETFIKAACILASENPDLHFVLVGKGVEERNGYINGLVTATAVADRFHLLGHRSDVNHITAGLDIACCSSLSEGSPNVVAEAMACGVACVATDVGDSSLILQELGRVVPPRDPEAFAQACRETLAIPPSRRRSSEWRHGRAQRNPFLCPRWLRVTSRCTRCSRAPTDWQLTQV